MEVTPVGNLIWIDLEMTGLDYTKDSILEIATVITDSNLNILSKGPDLAIFQEEEVIHNMNSWSEEQHELSGLTEKVRNSKVNETQAEQQTLDFLQQYVKGFTSPMCGNSIHQDRMFLRRYMPRLEEFFHYRNLDVSSFKIAASAWNPAIVDNLTKKEAHTAMSDVLESIKEMKHYRDHLIIHL